MDPSQNPTFDATALNLLADASFLDDEGALAGHSKDYGTAVWPGDKQIRVQQDISALEMERERLTLLLGQQQQQQPHYAAPQPQHPIPSYGGHLQLETGFASHSSQTAYPAQSHHHPDTSYQTLISPVNSNPGTPAPYYTMASQYPPPAPSPFELHTPTALSVAAAHNYNYFETAAHFSNQSIPSQGQPQLQSQSGNPNSTSQSSSANSPVDEDKRQRNSAASARFRAKRKQREEALQSETRQKQQTLQQLETRVRSLEAENLFLRRLLIEKDGDENSKSAAGGGNTVLVAERHVTGVGTDGVEAEQGKGKGRA